MTYRQVDRHISAIEGFGISTKALLHELAMTPTLVRLLECFLKAKQVNHHYNVHTDGDELDGQAYKPSMENLRVIVERMKRLRVDKDTVDYEDVRFVRGLIERWDDHVSIIISLNQSEEWRRFTFVKELFHALADKPSELSADGVKTLKELAKYPGFNISWDTLSEEVRAEKLAEIFALELAYPLEYRENDRDQLKDNKISISDLAQKRGVPVVWIERALDPQHMAECKEWWDSLPDVPFPALEPFAPPPKK